MKACAVGSVINVGLITTRGHSKEVVIVNCHGDDCCNSYDGNVGREDYLILGMMILMVQALPLLWQCRYLYNV